ncbi:unnamed protein product, partial [Brassica oleracea var. botrytis]
DILFSNPVPLLSNSEHQSSFNSIQSNFRTFLIIALMEIAPFSIRFKLYDQLELLEFPNKFFIKPVDSHHQGFSVDRRDVNIKPLDAVAGKLFRTGICISFRELLCLIYLSIASLTTPLA